jgi:hypothetical protein
MEEIDMTTFTTFSNYILEMAKVKTNTNRNYDIFSDEEYFNTNKSKTEPFAKNLWFMMAKNENKLYILSDDNNEYVASIEIDSENTNTINNKKVFWIDAGYSKVRGGYAQLLNAILEHTDYKFIMSDLSLSDRAAKFWAKYVEAIDTSKYKAVIYNAETKELTSFDKSKAFSYDNENNGNEYNHIGIMK